MLCGDESDVHSAAFKTCALQTQFGTYEEPVLYRTAWRLSQVGLTPFHMLPLSSLSLAIRIVIGLLLTATIAACLDWTAEELQVGRQNTSIWLC
jgi:hypothetical protein